MNITRSVSMFVLGLLAVASAQAQNVIEDGGVGLSYEELEYIVSQWPPHMQQAAAGDSGDRFELLNMVMVVKKLAHEADQYQPGDEAYFRYRQKMDSEKRKFVVQEFANTIEVPDMTALAKERYETQKDKYALMPEQRMTSHILISCPTGSRCSRPAAQEEAQQVLDQLRAGADFEELVLKHSNDPGSKDKGGKFDRWLTMGDKTVSPPYLGGAFTIEEPGEYSEIVNTQFGVHVIRLDEVKEKYYLPFHKVVGSIKSDLTAEYRKLALKDYRARYNLSDDTFINGEAMDKIFSKYGSAN